jgi:TonB-dependent receptor
MYIENNEKYGLFPSRLISRMLAKASIVVLSAVAVMTPASAQDDADAALEEVIVTGLRGTLQSAQKIKFDAEQIVDSIVADDIANLPDRSVTETLQRIPGVTIDHFISRNDPEHFGGEGSGVAIRGLTQVRGEINGRDGFTANGGRTLSFEDVPPELLAGVDVYKNPSADMIEGGLGGTVNLRTRMPFDLDEQLIGFTASASYQNLIEETTPAFSGIYSDRWDTGAGEMGFLIDVAYSKLKGRVDAIFSRPYVPYDHDADPLTADQYIPRGADWRTERTDRERKGLYTAYQWRPNDEMEYYLTVFRSEYDMNWDEDALFVNNATDTMETTEGNPLYASFADPVFDSNNAMISGTLIDTTEGGVAMGSDVRLSQRNSVTTDVSTGFNWQLDDSWFVSTDLQYVKATTDAFDSTVATGTLLPYITMDVSSGRPHIQTDNAYMADPANYYAAFTMEHFEDNEAEQLALRADAEYTFNNIETLRSLKFGVRFTDLESSIVNTGYNWYPVIQPWMRGWALDGNLPLPTLADMFTEAELENLVHVNTFDNFYRGGVPNPGGVVAPNVSVAQGFPDSYLTLHNAALPYYTCCYYDDSSGTRVTNWAPRELDPSQLNDQTQTTSSAYLMLRFGWDDIGVDGNIGVRYVETESTSTGYTIYPSLTNAGPTVVAFFDAAADGFLDTTNSYSHTLPSLNLRWKLLDDQLVLRLAASQAIFRPDFNQLSSYIQLNANLNDGAPDGSDELSDYHGSAGANNPYLNPLEADQYDVSAEWYYSDIGQVWLTLFRKDIDGFIRQEYIDRTFPATGDFVYNIEQPANQEWAKIDGWELGWRQFWDSGFGIEASYTRINSEAALNDETIPVDTDGQAFGVDVLPYEGLSENSYSTIFMFENSMFSTRLAYTWRDEFLVGVGANGFNGNHRGIDWRLPVFQKEYGQWDGSVFYNISDQYKVGLEMNNLTNEEIVLIGQQIAATDRTRTYTVQDSRYAITFSASF